MILLEIKVKYGPNDATGFKAQGCPETYVVLTADEEDGADAVVWLCLLESGAKAVAAGVMVHAEDARVVGHSVPVGENQDRRLDEVVEELQDDVFHGRSEEEFDSWFEKGRDGAWAFGQLVEGFPVVADAIKERTRLLHVRRHLHFG